MTQKTLIVVTHRRGCPNEADPLEACECAAFEVAFFNAMTRIAELESEQESSVAALREARADSARIDFLESQRASVHAVVQDEFDQGAVPELLRFGVEVDFYKTRVGGGFCDITTDDKSSLRKAIDSARSSLGDGTRCGFCGAPKGTDCNEHIEHGPNALNDAYALGDGTAENGNA